MEYESAYYKVPELQSFGQDRYFVSVGQRFGLHSVDRESGRKLTTAVDQTVHCRGRAREITRGIKVIAGLSQHAVLPSTMEKKQLNFIMSHTHGSSTFTHQPKKPQMSGGEQTHCEQLSFLIVWCWIFSCPATLLPSSNDAGTLSHHTNESSSGPQRPSSAVHSNCLLLILTHSIPSCKCGEVHQSNQQSSTLWRVASAVTLLHSQILPNS